MAELQGYLIARKGDAAARLGRGVFVNRRDDVRGPRRRRRAAVLLRRRRSGAGGGTAPTSFEPPFNPQPEPAATWPRLASSPGSRPSRDASN